MFGGLTFKGGVHPKDNKKSTSFKSIQMADVPSELAFPLLQHIGAPCEACVAVGDSVKIGTKIADSEAFVSAPIHSSVSGIVKAIEPRPMPNGTMVSSIIIENDFLDTYEESNKPINYKGIAPNDIPGIVREAGIVGMGGATFPTHVKLMPPKEAKIDTIIVNGSECEPYLTSDHRVMLETPDELIMGLKILLYRFGLKNGHIAIEDNKKDAIELLKEKCNGEGITIDTLKKKYPQGGEKQLIYAVMKRKVPIGKLPADVGVIVVNIDTCSAIGRKFMYGIPLIRRIVTISGTPIKNPSNVNVRIGTTIDFLIKQNGGFRTTPEKVIIGGPMMGITQFRLDVPIIKGTSSILCLTKREAEIPDEGPCIRCGKCIERCPMNLMPTQLNNFALKNELDKCEKYNVTSCIECGCCSYICPAKKNIVQNVRIAKQKVLAMQKQR